MNEHFFVYNGQFFPVGAPVISAGNRSLRYGDGLFETMRLHQGRILNVSFHFDRLFRGLTALKFNQETFTAPFFLEKINELLNKNNQEKNARIRLMVFRGDGPIFDTENSWPNYLIETALLPEKIELNKNGLVIDVFPDARKTCDLFSNLKTNNYLPYLMAGIFAQQNKLDDAIILNAFDRVCESAISNIFIIKGKNIFTPPLSEGCVAGVMRRCMLEKFSLKDYTVSQKNLSIDELLDADELFLTNAIQPVRWVKKFRENNYRNDKVKEIFECYTQSL